jgi:signal transduction histidine kinase
VFVICISILIGESIIYLFVFVEYPEFRVNMALSVEDVMKREVVAVQQDSMVKDAATIMTEKGISSLVILNGEELVGILTEKDLANKVVSMGLNPKEVPVSAIMTTHVLTIKAQDNLEEAIRLMNNRGIKKLPVTSSDGKLVGMLSQTDVTTLYSTLYANAELGKSVSQLGHDLRGPLGNIRNSTYLIERHPEKANEYLSYINEAVDLSTRMLDDVKKRASEGLVTTRDVRLSSFIGALLDQTAPPPGCIIERVLISDAHVMFDELKIRRVIDNLLKNSFEALSCGGVIKISTLDNGEWASIRVEDNGCGISEEIMRNMFSTFNTSKANGTGLGLSYSKRIVEAHKGLIRIESTSGQGTVVTLTFPVIKVALVKELATSAYT